MIQLLALNLFFFLAGDVLANSSEFFETTIDKNIKNNLGSIGKNLIEFHETFCSLKSLSQLKSMHKITNDLEIKKISHSYLDNSIKKENVKISLDENHPEFNLVDVTLLKEGDSIPQFYRLSLVKEVNYLRTFKKRNLVASAELVIFKDSSECHFKKVVRFFKKNERMDGLIYLELDENGLSVKKHYSTQDPKSLKEIFNDDEKIQEKIRNLQYDDKRIKVGLIDTGVDYNHPEIAYKIARRFDIDEEENWVDSSKSFKDKKIRNNLIDGIDLKDRDSSPYDFDGVSKIGHLSSEIQYHGTEVAHAMTKGSDKIILYPARYGYLSLLSIGRLVNEQIKKGVRIINMSFNYSPLFKMSSLDHGVKKVIRDNPDILFVIAAGNEASSKPTYPGAYDFSNIINVAAVDETLNLWKWSNYGSAVDVAALGVHDLIKPGNHDISGVSSGTSFAAPVVSRVAAHMLYENPDLSPQEIKNIICDTIDVIDSLKGKLSCPGIVNEEKAVELAKNFKRRRSSHL